MNELNGLNSVTFNRKTVCPSKAVCIGRNYADHIAELENEVPTEPVIFIKPNSALSDKLAVSALDEIHYETELALLIQNGAIAGLGLALDLTNRNKQAELKRKGLPWERSKAFDGSLVVTPFVKTPHKLENISFSLEINGEEAQQGNYALMINKPHDLLTEIQTVITLVNNDLVLTGTPKGVGVIGVGDEFVVKLFNQDMCILEQKWVAQ